MSRWASTISEAFSLQPTNFDLLPRHARWARKGSLGEQGL
ncbi:hypothetical protein A2U01_0093302, partial [Trifolium medium]|nr:hypothetical protein [Trifolium medium]